MAEPRYFLTLFPIFSLFSIYTVKEIARKFDKTKLISIIIGITVLSLSIVYLDYTKIDYQHELEAYQIGLEVHKRASIINTYHPEIKYAYGKDDVFWNLGTFPVLHSETERKVKGINTFNYSTCLKERAMALVEGVEEPSCVQYTYASLDEFIDISKNDARPSIKVNEVTHIVTDENSNRVEFLKDVFKNEEEYAYLTKIYDSSEKGYDYHLKIFKINYEKFESGR